MFFHAKFRCGVARFLVVSHIYPVNCHLEAKKGHHISSRLWRYLISSVIIAVKVLKSLQRCRRRQTYNLEYTRGGKRALFSLYWCVIFFFYELLIVHSSSSPFEETCQPELSGQNCCPYRCTRVASVVFSTMRVEQLRFLRPLA